MAHRLASVRVSAWAWMLGTEWGQESVPSMVAVSSAGVLWLVAPSELMMEGESVEPSAGGSAGVTVIEMGEKSVGVSSVAV